MGAPHNHKGDVMSELCCDGFYWDLTSNNNVWPHLVWW